MLTIRRLFHKGISEDWILFHIDIKGNSTEVCDCSLKVANSSYRVKQIKMSEGIRNDDTW